MKNKGTKKYPSILILQNGVSVVHETINKCLSKVTKINNRRNNNQWECGIGCVRS